MTRRGELVFSLELLRMILDLPSHLELQGIIQTEEDRRNGTGRLLVSGPFVPECPEGAKAPELTPVYRHVETGRTFLDHISGLDT